MKYMCSYRTCGGFENSIRTNNIEEVEIFVDGKRDIHSCEIIVFDTKLKDYIYFKNMYSYSPSVDMIFTSSRDLRTLSKKRKGL